MASVWSHLAAFIVVHSPNTKIMIIALGQRLFLSLRTGRRMLLYDVHRPKTNRINNNATKSNGIRQLVSKLFLNNSFRSWMWNVISMKMTSCECALKLTKYVIIDGDGDDSDSSVRSSVALSKWCVWMCVVANSGFDARKYRRQIRVFRFVRCPGLHSHTSMRLLHSCGAQLCKQYAHAVFFSTSCSRCISFLYSSRRIALSFIRALSTLLKCIHIVCVLWTIRGSFWVFFVNFNSKENIYSSAIILYRMRSPWNSYNYSIGRKRSLTST